MLQMVKNKLNTFIEQYGWKGVLTVLFYPLITFVTTPIRLIQTLWNCRVLAEGKDWQCYPHFSPHSAMISLFYWTSALNLYRFGRSGKSSCLGLGDYHLSQLFHYSLPSLYAYWKAGAVTLLLGMSGWWVSYFLWFDANTTLTWCLVIIFLTLISTFFYSHTFACQNYNVLGWMFLPVVLYGWFQGNWMLAALACLGASFGSITVVFLVSLLSVVYSLELLSFYPFFTIFPASIKLLLHLWPNFAKGSIIKTLSNIFKAIGITNREVKYSRKGTMRLGTSKIYRFVIYVQFVIVFLCITGNFPVLLILFFLLSVINVKYFRFADDQSMDILIVTVSASLMLSLSKESIWLIISYWLLISPLPLLSGYYGFKYNAIVPVLVPVDIRPILDATEMFLSPAKKGSRILMAFDDPGGQYERLFDGYRYLIDIPKYAATKKEIHFFPDWWGVFEVNYEGAPDFWGRDVEDIQKQMKNWEADYVIVYQESDTVLERKWTDAGFRELTHISWKKFDTFFGEDFPFTEPVPDWWLLGKDNEPAD